MSKQYRKVAMSIKSLFGVTVLFVIGCVFIFEALLCFRVINNWNSTAIIEYQGQYTYLKVHYWRNVNYKFILENGDILTVPCEHVANENFKNYPDLLFKYSSPKSLFLLGKHRLLSLQTTDNSYAFVEEDTTMQEMHFGAVGFIIIGVFSLICSFLPLLFPALVSLVVKTRRKKTGDGFSTGDGSV